MTLRRCEYYGSFNTIVMLLGCDWILCHNCYDDCEHKKEHEEDTYLVDDDPFDAAEYAEYYSEDEDVYSDIGNYIADHMA